MYLNSEAQNELGITYGDDYIITRDGIYRQTPLK